MWDHITVHTSLRVPPSPSGMPPTDPAALWCGGMVVHINDIGVLASVVEVFVKSGIGSDVSITAALEAHEDAMATVRELGFGARQTEVSQKLRDSAQAAFARHVIPPGRKVRRRIRIAHWRAISPQSSRRPASTSAASTCSPRPATSRTRRRASDLGHRRASDLGHGGAA